MTTSGRAAPRIIGICLVKNEENFLLWSLMNIAAFCDEILVLDNQSDDRTPQLLAALTARNPHIRVLSVEDAYDTHKYVEPYAGQNVWMFGVDGDEIYDPAGLARLKQRIHSGEFDGNWRLRGHSLHTKSIEWARATANGYAQPDARSVTKLYNFNAISSWSQGRHERLHGKNIVFRPGFSETSNRDLSAEEQWSQSCFRCLHICFAPRSSLDRTRNGRSNPAEIMKSKRWTKRVWDPIAALLSKNNNYKERFYERGPLRTVGIAGFNRPATWLDIDPDAPGAEQIVAVSPS